MFLWKDAKKKKTHWKKNVKRFEKLILVILYVGEQT